MKSSTKSKYGVILSIWIFDGKIAFEDIVIATENFDEKYCIGDGGYGSVFRVQLEGSTIFAVKLLHSMEEYTNEETFHAKIEVLTKMRHTDASLNYMVSTNYMVSASILSANCSCTLLSRGEVSHPFCTSKS